MENFDDNTPIYLQVKHIIMNMIIHKELCPHDKIPSTNEMVRFYKINHLTISKGIQLLVDEGILYKKRGIGMFVSDDALARIVAKRKEAFQDDFLLPLIKEAKTLQISIDDLVSMLKKEY